MKRAEQIVPKNRKSLNETHETRGERELYSSECNLSGRSKLTK